MDSELLKISNIPNPEDYICNISYYLAHHPVLRIALFEPSSEKWLTLCFDKAIFFEGPSSWEGIDIKVEDPKDSIQWFQERRKREPKDIKGTFDVGYRFFVMHSEQGEFRVLASDLSVKGWD